MRQHHSRTMREKAQESLEFMPEFLEVACQRKTGALEAIQETAAWSGFMAPYSRLPEAWIEDEIEKRLDALIPVLLEHGNEDVAKTFVALLMWSAAQDEVEGETW